MKQAKRKETKRLNIQKASRLFITRDGGCRLAILYDSKGEYITVLRSGFLAIIDDSKEGGDKKSID